MFSPITQWVDGMKFIKRVKRMILPSLIEGIQDILFVLR